MPILQKRPAVLVLSQIRYSKLCVLGGFSRRALRLKSFCALSREKFKDLTTKNAKNFRQVRKEIELGHYRRAPQVDKSAAIESSPSQFRGI